MKKIFREILIPAGMMASLVIGAGMFSLPYVFARAGTIAGFIYMVVMTLVAIEIHRSYAEIINSSEEKHRFSGYAAQFLGRQGKLVGSISVIGGIFLTLAIYLTLSVSFTALIFPNIPAYAAVLFFWAIGSIFIAAGIKKFAGLDIFFFLGIVAAVAAMLVFGLIKGDGTAFNLRPTDITGLLLPFAPILFSLSGRSAISSLDEYFHERGYDQKNLKRAITLGTAIPVAVYLAFIAGVTLLSPLGITPDAVSGIFFLPAWMYCAIGFLGFSAIITSYTFLGLELKGIAERDFGVKQIAAAVLVIGLPVIIYFSGFNNFLPLIGFAGGVFLATESALTIMMRRSASLRRKPYDIILMAVFGAAVIYEIISLFVK